MINFKNKPKIGEMEDPHRGRIINIHYIDSDTEVGLDDGVDRWMGQVGYCCFSANLPRLIQQYKQGGAATLIRRRVVIDAPQEQPIRRRVYVE